MKLSLRIKNSLLFVLFVSSISFAQLAKTPLQVQHSDHEKCGSSHVNEMLMKNDPAFALKRQEAEAHYQEYLNAPFNLKAVKTIPIVVHIIHRGEAIGTGSNISEAQILSAINNLNQAYRNQAPYTGVDTEIEFCLAQRDPNGNPHSGINRVSGNSVTNYSTQGIISTNELAVKALSKWDNTKYYNFWIVAEIDNNDGGSGTQGYAYFPGAGSDRDGAVMLFNSFGYDPDGSLGYNLKNYTNRNVTTIHEVGHALNLYHTFEGDGSGSTCPGAGNLCGSGVGDCVSDTPPHRRSNSDCNTGGTNSCDGGSSNTLFVHNFMDYSSDVCQTRFTAGQSTRMNAVLAPGGLRNSLTNSDGCNPANNNFDAAITSIVAPTSSYCQTVFSPQINLRNFGLQTLTSVIITYNIDGGTNQIFNWTGNLVSGASEIVTLNSISTSTGAHTFNASSSMPNGQIDEYSVNDGNSVSFNITSSSTLPFIENFESTTFPPTGWSRISADGIGTNWGTNGIKEWVRRLSSGNGTSTASAAINCYNYNFNGGSIDELVTPSINLSTASSPQLTFNVAYEYYGPSNEERLRVLISTDCGVNYTPLYNKSGTTLQTKSSTGNSFTPSAANHWRLETLDLSPYAGQVVTIKFESTNGYGNNLYLDDINITDNCVSPVVTSNPSNSSICSTNNTSFTVSNSGGGTYQWQVNTGSGFNNIVNGGIYSNATTSTLNLTGVGISENGNQYRCVITNSCGSVTSSFATLTVNQTPSTPTISTSGATTFCEGGSVTLTSSNPSGNIWSNGQTTESIIVSNTGDYSVSTIINGCSSGTSAQTSVTVNPNPIISQGTTNNPSSCGGTDGSIQINGTGTGVLSWNGTTTGSINGFVLGNFVSNLGAGSYNFSFNNGCESNSISVSLSDPGSPSTPTISSSGPTTICEGESVTLTSSSLTDNIWSNGATSSSIIVNTSGTFTVQVSVAGCNSANSTPVDVVVNAIPSTPTISTSGATTFCEGGSVTLTSSNPSGNVWSDGQTTESIIVSNTGDYSVSTIINGCSSGTSAQTSVTVNPNPIISQGTTNNPSSCGGTDGSIQINGTGTGVLSWNGTSTGSINGFVLGNFVSNLGAGSYNFTFNNGCESNSISVSLSDPGVIIPTISSSNGNTICEGESITLTSSSASGNTWSTGETTQSIIVSVENEYSVSVFDAGCTVSSDIFTLTVNLIPTTPSITASGSTDFCSGENVVLTSSSLNGNTWSTGETTQSITVSSSGSFFVNVIENACISEQSNVINVNVTQTPVTPTITADGATTICIGESVNLTSDATSNNTWSNGSTSQTINVTESGTYSVTVNNGSCTATSNEITITVNSTAITPTITSSGSLNFCEGGSVTLTSSESSGNIWSNGATTNSITVSESGQYTVSIGTGNCAGTSEIASVTVNPLPLVTLDAFEDICNTAAEFDLTQGSPANGSYTVNGNNATQFVPSTASIGANTISYTFTDGNQCTSSASQTIIVNDCSSIEKIVNTKFKVYPNPTSSIVKIESDVNFTEIEVKDELGRSIFKSQSSTNEIVIDFSKYATGIYTLIITGNDFEEIQKINFVK
jgi:hypothetical protein